MLPVVLLAVAYAGWTLTDEGNGCRFFKGSAESTPAGEVVPLRAECDWPISARTLQDLLAQSGDHDDYFSAVVESTVVGTDPDGGDLVYQVHRAAGISDREVELRMWSEDIPGGKRYNWTRSKDRTKLTGKRVEVPLDTGKWEVTSSGTGAHVVYELRYLAGGSVPGFLVRWFQGAGMEGLVGELRKAGEAASKASG